MDWYSVDTRILKPELKASYFHNNAAAVEAIRTTNSVGVQNGTSNFYISNWPISAMIKVDDEAN